MKIRSLLLTFVTTLIIVSAPAFGDSQNVPVKIGVSGPLSGSGAGWGNDVKNVLAFANEKLAQGKYSFVLEDDLCDSKTALSVASKLSTVDRVATVLIVCGQSTLAAAKIYHATGIPVIAPLATPSGISSLGIFRTSLSDAMAARKLANYMVAHERSISVLTEDNEYPVSFLADFSKVAKELKLTYTNENYLPQEHDFRTRLLRLKAQHVHALFLNTQAEETLLTLIKQLREIRFAPQLYGAYLPGSSTFLKLAGTQADGLVFVDYPGAKELLTSEGRTLYDEYLKRYGELQAWSYAFPATFEAFRAIHGALSSGMPADQYLHATTFQGVFGSYTFDANGDIVGPHHVLRRIQGGRAQPLSGRGSDGASKS